MERKLIALSIEVHDDGRLVVYGSVPGLFLASEDHAAAWRDLGPALQALLIRNEQWPKLPPSRFGGTHS